MQFKEGALFNEFKCDLAPSLTYSVFTLKRLLFAGSLTLLSEFPYVQAILNCLVMLGFAVFLIAVRPYKDGVTQVVCIVVEIGVSLMFGLVIYFLQQGWRDWDQELEITVLCLSYAAMGVHWS